MQYSLKNLHNYVPERVDPRRIGIIGGKGAMGQLLEREFKKDGYEVITTGENPSTGATGRALRHLNRSLVRHSDVIVLSVPIKNLTLGIDGIVGSNLSRGLRGKLFVDVCSTKMEPLRQLQRLQGPSLVGLHPMFGPAVRDFKGLNVVVCPALQPGVQRCHVMEKRLEKWTDWIEEFWRFRGANIVRMTPSDHDQIMPPVQFDVLLAVLSYSAALKATGADLNAMQKVGTPNSRLLTACVGRMLDVRMMPTYTNLSFENVHNLTASAAFAATAVRIHELLSRGDRHGFQQLVSGLSDFLEGNGRNELQQTAVFLQRVLSNRDLVEGVLAQHEKSQNLPGNLLRPPA